MGVLETFATAVASVYTRILLTVTMLITLLDNAIADVNTTVSSKKLFNQLTH